jgi:hypothetical protein
VIGLEWLLPAVGAGVLVGFGARTAGEVAEWVRGWRTDRWAR